jgi:MFS family permease
MLASLSLSLIGAIMLVLFGVFYWLSVLATTRAILAFLGTILIAGAGFIGGALTTVATWLSNLGGSVSGWAFGVHAGGIIATIIVGVVFIHDLMPKKTAGKRTGWAGIILAALIVSGVTGIPALSNVPSAVRNGVQNAQTIGG